MTTARLNKILQTNDPAHLFNHITIGNNIITLLFNISLYYKIYLSYPFLKQMI